MRIRQTDQGILKTPQQTDLRILRILRTPGVLLRKGSALFQKLLKKAQFRSRKGSLPPKHLMIRRTFTRNATLELKVKKIDPADGNP